MASTKRSASSPGRSSPEYLKVDLSPVAADTFQAAFGVFAPPPNLTVSQWADRERQLSPEASAEPGRWDTSRAEYQRGIMDAVSDPLIHTVVIMTSSQVGKSEILLNLTGFHIDKDPAPILIVQPTLEMSQAFSKDRIAPMVRDAPALAGKIAPVKARDSGNTTLHKALALDTPLATPNGWTTMGEVKPGDMVFDESGEPCRVTYVTPIMEGRPCYRVTFSDGSSLVADEDHPWQVERWAVRKASGKAKQTIVSEVVTTAELRQKTPDLGRLPFAIPVAKPIDLPSAELPVDPYILGAWLGDGLSHAARIVASPLDAEIADHLKRAGAHGEIRGKGRIIEVSLDAPSKRGRLPSGRFPVAPKGSFRGRLRALGIMTVRGGHGTLKAIPQAYLRASHEQRLSLLQGLMDTDGSIRRDGWAVFASANPMLVEGVRELVATLGLKCTVKEVRSNYRRRGNGEHTISWRVEFAPGPDVPVFRLSRKALRQTEQKPLTSRCTRRRVSRVEPVASVPVRCISVDSPSHLYLAGREMIPTHNTFPGGHLTIVGANSPAGLASRPIRIVLADEVDRYDESAGTEGDPVNLAVKRTTTFWNRKIVLASTPGIKGLSRIERAFEGSDKRRFFVPCPDCGHEQHLKWSRVHWSKEGEADALRHRPETAHYGCEECGALWNDVQRWTAVRKGRWVAEGEFTGVAGFHLNELYSPWRRLEETVREHLAAKGAPALLKTWINTALGEPWEDDAEKIEAQSLLTRGEEYDTESLPDRVRMVTVGVDVQDDRLECSRWGWGEGEESWLVEHHVIFGDLSTPGPWDDLDEWLRAPCWTEGGVRLTTRAACIDMGGHFTQEVLKFCRDRRGRKVFAIKGVPGAKPIWTPKSGRSKKGALPFWNVGVDTAKDMIYGRLRIRRPESAAVDVAAPGYVHLPSSVTAAFVAQLVAEVVVIEMLAGRPVRRWKLPANARNEALDCAVYALAARESFGKRLPGGARAPAPEPEREAGDQISPETAPQGAVVAQQSLAARPMRAGRGRWNAYR